MNLEMGDRGPLVIWQEQPIVMVVESALSALLVAHEVGDLIGVIGLGSERTRPDFRLHDRLMRAKTLLCSLDNDDAGAQESWRAGVSIEDWLHAAMS